MSETLQLSADDHDRLLRLTADALDLTAVNTLLVELLVPQNEPARDDLLDRQRAAWDRIAADADLLRRVIEDVTEPELERVVAESAVSNGARTAFLAVTRREGGIQPMLQQRVEALTAPSPTLQNGVRLWKPGACPTANETEVDADTKMALEAATTLICVGGAILIAGGAGLALTGGGVLAGFALVVGVVAVAEAC